MKQKKFLVEGTKSSFFFNSFWKKNVQIFPKVLSALFRSSFSSGLFILIIANEWLPMNENEFIFNQKKYIEAQNLGQSSFLGTKNYVICSIKSLGRAV